MATPDRNRPRRRRPLDLRREIRDFVRSHPGGWHHADWVQFLDGLRDAGYDVSDPERIGVELERLRLLETLVDLGVEGLGPRRRDALVARFQTLWEMKHATVDQIAAVEGFNRSLAERVRAALN